MGSALLEGETVGGGNMGDTLGRAGDSFSAFLTAGAGVLGDPNPGIEEVSGDCGSIQTVN